MTGLPPDALNIDFWGLHIGAVGVPAIVVVAIIVGAYVLGRALRHL
jgi:hypothetical protein